MATGLDPRDGTFTIPNVANGTYTLRVAKAGYETQTRSVTVTGANVGGHRREPAAGVPVGGPGIHRGAQGGRLDPAAAPRKPCHSYSFASHHSGDVRAFAAWTNTASATADFDFEYWCNGRLVEARGMRGNDHDEILPRISAGQSCEIHIVLFSGGPMRYTLYLYGYPYWRTVGGSWCGLSMEVGADCRWKLVRRRSRRPEALSDASCDRLASL